MKKFNFLKIFLVVLCAALCLCSCELAENTLYDIQETSAAVITSVVDTAEEDTTDESADETSPPEIQITETSGSDTEPAKWYTFRNKQRYDEHYKKHGAEFGSITKEEYLELANELINSDSDRVLHKYSDDGDYMYFDQDTEYFLVLSADGYIRTFFIPTAGINYWNRQ